MAECLHILGKAHLKTDGFLGGWVGRSDGGYEGMQSLGGAGYEGQDYLRQCGSLLHSPKYV